jgi:acetolactate decarboxylase
MKNKMRLSVLTAMLCAVLLTACGKETVSDEVAHDRDCMYQVSLLQGLTFGDYYGSITVEELEKNGDTGIGTFNRLNGELIMIDGETYRAAGDGSVELVSDEETIPFSVVTYLDQDETRDLREIRSYEELCIALDEIVAERGKNRFYMVRIDGNFNEINVRSVNAQDEPYEPLVDALERDQTFFDYENIEGTMIGLYCPPYMADLNAVGWHLHFISKDKTKGGHVLGINFDDAVLTWDDTDGFDVKLPQNEMFAGFDLTIDQTEDIKKAETNK